MPMWILAAHSQLRINGLTALHDSITNFYLCSIPEDYFGANYDATLDFSELGWTDVIIDGTAVSNGEYTFQLVEGGKYYPVTATCGCEVIHTRIGFTYLPLVWLQGEFGHEYVRGLVTLCMPGEVSAGQWHAKVKWRGWYTNYDFKHKRNYHIKFVDANGEKLDRRLFGLRKDNSWLLDAGQIDLARLRNRTATELWMDFNARPYWADREPEMLPGVRGEVVEVFLNGEYRGVFGFTEALDRKQLKIKKFDETTTPKTIHGQLWKTDRYNEITRMTGINNNWNNNSALWTGYEIKYPEIEDVKPTDWSVLYNAIDFVANSSDYEFCKHVGEYFDLPMIRDYMVLVQTLMADDNNGKNMVWVCYDRAEDKKLTLFPWDLDVTLGQCWNNAHYHYSAQGWNKEVSMSHRLLHRLKTLNPGHFYDGVIQRYHELRSTILSQESLTQRYAEKYELLMNSGAGQRESARWTNDTDIGGYDLDFPTEYNFIKNYISRRLNYLDQNVFVFRQPLVGDINGDYMVDAADLNDVINAILGRYTGNPQDVDYNGDGVVDVMDLNTIINVILGSNNP